MHRALPLLLVLATACGTGVDGNTGLTVHDPIHVDARSCVVRPGTIESGRRVFRLTSNRGEAVDVRFSTPDGPLGDATVVRDRITHLYVPPGELTIDCPTGARATVAVPLRNSTAPPDRTLPVVAKEFRFENLGTFAARSGETVRFDVRNVGGMGHVFQVRDPAGRVVGETVRIAGGRTETAAATFERAGTYTYVCELGDHGSRMKGTFVVR